MHFTFLAGGPAGLSVLMTFELPELFQLTRSSELGVSHVSDNVVVLPSAQPSPTEATAVERSTN